MEDPWLNAWHDPLKHSPRNSSPSISSSKFITDDQADIGLPSWDSSDPAPTWTGATDLHDELWSRESRTSQPWTTPTLDSIGFAKPPDEPLSTPNSPRPPSPQHLDQERQTSPETTITPATPPEEAEPSPAHQSLPDSLGGFGEEQRDEVAQTETSPDPEGFGTFSPPFDGQTVVDSWTPSTSAFPQTEETVDWGTTWKDQSESVDNNVEESVDEWELAKRQKENQDRYVPPAFLDSILSSYAEFAGDYWPEQQLEDVSDGYQPNREDLAEILGIASIVDRVIPSDPSLSVPTPFIKTFTSKEMIETLKLTRHHIITRHSPLAVYLNTKGSLSWEAAVKSTPDITEADVIPVGWRILPKENVDQLQSTNDTKKKTTGGLLSFFGRRSIAGSPPIRPNTPTANSPRSSNVSPRPSTDTANAIAPNVAKPAWPATSKEFDAISSASMPTTAQVSGTSQMIDNHASPVIEEHPQTPSVVSRILGRFSRSNKSTNPNPRDSIALSSDDLAFLSDIVPSASDDIDEPGSLNTLSDMLHPPPVPAKLPPPLAPPPRAPPLPKPPSPPAMSPRLATEQGPSVLTRGSRSNLDFDVLTSWSPPASTSQLQLTSLYTKSRPLSSTPIIPTLPPPLSPAASRSNTPIANTKPPMPSADSLFNDEFSDFQTPAAPSVSQLSIDPFSSSPFTTQASSRPLQINQTHSFDDFNDFISSPAAETPKSLRVQHSSIMLPTPSPPVPPSKRPRPTSLHDRRVSRQADSDQRALNLLEVAAARGKWPAPPSPLPSAIAPPPQTNKATTSSLLDMFDEADEPSPSAPAVQLASIAESNPSPPPNTTMMKGITADGSLRPSIEISGAKPTVPLIPMRQPMQPTHPARGSNQSPAVKQQWRTSSPAAQPMGSSLRPSSPSLFTFENLNTNKSRSTTTPMQLPQQQQKPMTGALSSLANLTASAPKSNSSRNTGLSGGGKLSAQDLSFFEGL